METQPNREEQTVHWYPDLGLGGWLLMTTAMALMWGLLVAAVVALVRTPPSGPRRPERRDAWQLLDERFARGDIDETEYRARRRTLDAGGGPTRRSTDR